jgi:DNA-directed RNA polymerase sigma subunit (sigma70/sigma32)
MGTNDRGWDRKRSENLRASMTDAEIEALFERSRRDLDSLSIDEVGVLFFITRDRIRLIEARLKPDDSKKHRGR